jgi:hypothetical protein
VYFCRTLFLRRTHINVCNDTMSSLYLRARSTGLCPPSILLEECSTFDNVDGFEVAINKVIDDNGGCTPSFVRRPSYSSDDSHVLTLFSFVMLSYIPIILFLCRFLLTTGPRHSKGYERSD